MRLQEKIMKLQFDKSFLFTVTPYFFLIPFILLGSSAFVESNACIQCHLEITPELVELFAQDAHLDEQSCAGCHGGNPNADPRRIWMWRMRSMVSHHLPGT